MVTRSVQGFLASFGWERIFRVDWTAEATNDLLSTETVTVDGVTFQTADSTIDNQEACSVLGVTNGVGLNWTTSADGSIIFRADIVDMVPDYILTDQLWLVRRFSTADLSANSQVVNLDVINAAGTAALGLGRSFTSGVNALDVFSVDNGSFVIDSSADDPETAIGLLVQHNQAELYYGSPAAAPTFPDVVAMPRVPGSRGTQALGDDPLDSEQWIPGTDRVRWHLTRNGGVNFSIIDLEWAVYRRKVE